MQTFPYMVWNLTPNGWQIYSAFYKVVYKPIQINEKQSSPHKFEARLLDTIR
jgi:hypothetical protein